MQCRNTEQKKIILDIMKNNKTHPTADQIYAKARETDPHISKGTVYRNLGQMSEKGEILKIVLPDGASHYDSTLSAHYHFFCRNCQNLFDAPVSIDGLFETAESQMKNSGYTAEGHNLVFSGLCPECSKEGK